MASIWRQFLANSEKKSLLTLEVLDPETAECWSELFGLLLKARLKYRG